MGEQSVRRLRPRERDEHPRRVPPHKRSASQPRRDIIRGMSEHADAVLTLAADQLMTRDVKTCSSEDQLVDIMEVMTLQRIRHLPVIESGALHGIVSIGDVVKQRLEEVQSEAEELRRYIRSP
jgi:predicted transcriptional regulator